MSDQPTPTPKKAMPNSGAPSPSASGSTASGPSPIFGFTVMLGLAAIVFVVMQLPFAEDPGTMKRLGTACIALLIGLMIYSAARAMIESILKALVEIVAASVFLLDALAILLVLYWKEPITQWGIDMGMKESSAFWTIAVGIAALLFIANAIVFLLLHPLSRVVGTEIVIR